MTTIILPESVLAEMRSMRADADRFISQNHALLPRYNEVPIGGAATDPLSRGESLHTFLDSLGTMSPENALEAAKATARLFLSKHNERHAKDYVTLRSLEQDDGYLTGCYERIKRAMEPVPASAVPISAPHNAPRMCECHERASEEGARTAGQFHDRRCPMYDASGLTYDEFLAVKSTPILVIGSPRERTHPYSADNWYERFELEVIPAQHDPAGFIYVSGCGVYGTQHHLPDASNPIDALIEMLDEHQLDPRLASFYHPETPYWTVNHCHSDYNPDYVSSIPEHPTENPRYIDAEPVYGVPGVVRFDGNFITYSWGFSIDTNHAPTIERLQAAITANLKRDWETYDREEKTRFVNTLCDYSGEPRKGEDEAAMHERQFAGVMIVRAASVSDYLDRYYRPDKRRAASAGYVDGRDVILDSYTEELSRLGCVHTSHYDNITGGEIAWPFFATAWSPTECAEGDSGRVSWRIIRHILNGDGSSEFEYAQSEESGGDVLEFVNYEQAEAAAFSLRHPDTPAASPQSTFAGGRAAIKQLESQTKKMRSATPTFDLEDI